ncbi:MAG: restriction endonuclease subunit S, partial [Methylococcales bacterium]|nr:restriction endonuclease subunit S [Methylococcales bacterium]
MIFLKNSYECFQYSNYFKTDLPEHWTDKKLGHLAKEERTAFVDGPFGSDLKSSDYKDIGIPLIQLNNIRDSKHLIQNMKFITDKKKQELIRHLAIPGDVVIAKMAEPVARSAIVANNFAEYVIVADCVKMTPNLKLIDLSYLVWAINCDNVRINAELVATGTTRIRVNLGELKKLKIPYPPIEEQTQIANFLDHETRKIDTLIEKQQQLIQLLKEKRLAVISHAVTKGLNPDAPMKDSGVEWLGEVPEHWGISRFKFLCERIIAGPFGSSITKDMYVKKGYKVYGQEQVIPYDFSIGDYYISDQNFIALSRYEVNVGDILISCVGTFGKIAVFPSEAEKGIINPRLIKAVINSTSNPFYMCELIKSETVFKQFELLSRGGTMGVINIAILNEILSTVPPMKEQAKIVLYINQQNEKFYKLIDQSNLAVTLLQERRTALISAAVTGKI